MAATASIYERIETRLRRRVAGAAEGERLPSEPRLAEEFGVARMTVRAALAGLERDGLVERIPGRGTYVRRPAAQRPVGTLMSFHDQARSLGRAPRSRLLCAEIRQATDVEAEVLYPDIDSGAQCRVVVIERVRFFDDMPIAVERAAFPEELHAITGADLETGSLHAELRRLGMRPTLGSSILTATTASADAEVLQVSVDAPMLVETRTIVDQHGAPLERTVSAYVAQRYNLKVEFQVTASH